MDFPTEEGHNEITSSGNLRSTTVSVDQFHEIVKRISTSRWLWFSVLEDYEFILLLVTFLTTMTSFINSLPCQQRPGVKLKDAQVLHHLRQRYLFVKKFNVGRLPQPRKTRSTTIPGTDYCPWDWKEDINPDRVPRTIVKAACPGCSHFCRAVVYHHNVLVSRCDTKTGDRVWKWKQKVLPIAFVYDPYK